MNLVRGDLLRLNYKISNFHATYSNSILHSNTRKKTKSNKYSEKYPKSVKNLLKQNKVLEEEIINTSQKNNKKYSDFQNKLDDLCIIYDQLSNVPEHHNWHKYRSNVEKVPIFVRTNAIYECNVTIHSSRDILPEVNVFYELQERSDQECNEEGSHQKSFVPLSSKNGCLINIFWEECEWVVKIYTGTESVAVSFDIDRNLKFFREGIYLVIIR